MASPDSRSATAQDPSATPEGDRDGSGQFESEEFRRKLERARERRATALGHRSASKPAPPRPDTSVLVLRSAEPEPEPRVEPRPQPRPLTAPPRAAAPGRPVATDPARGRGAWLVAWTTMGAAAGCILVVIVRGASAPTVEALPPRPFALEATAPEAPAAPPDIAPAARPDWSDLDPAPAVRTTAPDRPGPAPVAPEPPRIDGPPSPALSAYAATPVRLLGGDAGRIARVTDQVRAAGIETVSTRSVDLAPATSVVRFFRAEDRPLAEGLARRLGADLQDLTSYAPAPPEPGVEVWLSAS